MDYQWDTHKAKINLHKHGIAFADATTVFSDDFAITITNNHSDEERYITIGIDIFARILVVVYTWRHGNIRIISARKATPTESRQYTKQL